MNKKQRREYNRKYMRQLRGLKRDCLTCAHLTGNICQHDGRTKNSPVGEWHTVKPWACCNWKKSIKISIEVPNDSKA